MAQTTTFWDRIADGYAAKPVADEEAYQRKLRITREYLRPDMEVLELGCGTGSTAISHAPFVRHLRATDVSRRMLEIAEEKAASAGVDNVTFERAAAEALDVHDDSTDAVLALSLLHLLDDWQGTVRDVYRMLKPGGVFVSSTACIRDDMAWFGLVAPLGRLLGVWPAVQVFRQAALEETLASAGFVIDHTWKPGKGKAVFIVAKKPDKSHDGAGEDGIPAPGEDDESTHA